MEAVGVRFAKNNFSQLASLVNEAGESLTVLKNGKPWVLIAPADPVAVERARKRELFAKLTAKIESKAAEEPAWDASLSDRDILGAERMRRFG